MSYESINLFVSDTAEYISINQNFRYMHVTGESHIGSSFIRQIYLSAD